MPGKQYNFQRSLLLFGIVLAGLFLINLSLGSVSIRLIDLASAFLDRDANPTYYYILWHFRLPKAITCLLAGALLSVCGLLMQTFFRNPLAGPDVLGLSAGASLAVAILLLAGRTMFQFLADSAWAVAIAAGSGSAAIFIIVMVLSRYVRDNASLLVVGLMLAAATSSIVGVLQYMSRAEDLQTFMIWTLGSVGGTSWPEILALFICGIVGITMVFAQIKSLNAWLLGENYARSLGVNISWSRMWIILATSLMTGTVTAFCGPIAFVGLAVPHLVRLFLPTTNHKILIPAVTMGGGTLLLFCDLVANIPGSTQLLPLNAVTSLIGAPVVIWMIIKSKRIRV